MSGLRGIRDRRRFSGRRISAIRCSLLALLGVQSKSNTFRLEIVAWSRLAVKRSQSETICLFVQYHGMSRRCTSLLFAVVSPCLLLPSTPASNFGVNFVGLSFSITRINLTLWDELACVAFEHVDKGQQIYISGRLISDTIESDDQKQQTYYKVVVQKLNFIEKSLSSISLYNGDSNSPTPGRKQNSSAANSTGSLEELWQAFFTNPMEWWDNRRTRGAQTIQTSSTKIPGKHCGLKAV